MLSAFSDILTNRGVHYETSFMYTQALSLLKLDSYEKDQTMVHFI